MAIAVREARPRTLRGIGQRTPAVESEVRRSHRREVNLVVFVLDRLMLSFPNDVLRQNVRRESDDRDAKPRKETGEHCAVGEHRVSPPRVTLGPRIE